jgi:hypothetical protein
VHLAAGRKHGANGHRAFALHLRGEHSNGCYGCCFVAVAAGFTAADGRRNWSRFMRCVNTLPDRVHPEDYLCPWFCNAPYEDIKRDNIAEMLVYGFYYAKM